MIRRLIILLLIVGCVFAKTDTTKTNEDNYKYFLETFGSTYFKIVDYEIINDEINITKNGSTWQLYPITQIKRITDLNRVSIWEDSDLIEQVNIANKKRSQKNKKNGGRKYYHPYFLTDNEINKFSYQDNINFKYMYLNYKDNKKHQPLGFILSFFPYVGAFTGHIYTGNWKKGFYFGSAELGLGLIGGYHLMQKFKQITNEPFCNTQCMNDRMKEEIIKLMPLNVILYTTHIWSMVEVYKDINTYNREIYKLIYGREPPSFSLNLQPTYQGANLTMSYSLD
jgi:hypothetical protein